MSYYIHHIPGRLRVKTHLIKRNRNTAEEVQKKLGQVNGINSVLVNTITGSITISYDTDTLSSQRILDILKQMGYFDASKAITNDQYIHTAVSKAGQTLGKVLFGAVIEKVFEGSALSLISILI